MISAVARIFEPGCKADYALVAEGKQGLGKSSGIKALAGGEWYTDDIADVGSKDAAMQVRGRLLVEIAELKTLTTGTAENSHVKAFMSRSVDHFRPPYGRRVGDFPRQAVLFGTVNHFQYLKDETGARRFWPISCNGPVRVEEIKRDRDQLWAEAVARYRKKEKWCLTPHIGHAFVYVCTIQRMMMNPTWPKRILLLPRWSVYENGPKAELS
jgi:predicted P-loop ATPase